MKEYNAILSYVIYLYFFRFFQTHQSILSSSLSLYTLWSLYKGSLQMNEIKGIFLTPWEATKYFLFIWLQDIFLPFFKKNIFPLKSWKHKELLRVNWKLPHAVSATPCWLNCAPCWQWIIGKQILAPLHAMSAALCGMLAIPRKN